MITKIKLANFKSFRSIEFDTKNLNVLTGLNGSGKSSLIQSLLFVRDVLMKSSSPTVTVNLNAGTHPFGSYSDLHYAYSQSDDDLVRVEICTDWFPAGFIFRVHDTSSDSDEVVVERSAQGAGDAEWHRLTAEFEEIQYVSAYRLPPQTEHTYSVSKSKKRTWGAMGEYAVAYLAEHGLSCVVAESLCQDGASDRFLASQVDAWMDVVSPGACIKAEMLGKLNKALLSISFAKGINNHPFLPQNVGFGISYVLPLIVMLLSAKEGDCLIVENPEAHLHPRGQAELGRLLSLVAARDVQIFVESHSDHVLNGVRVAAKKSEVPSGAIKVAFFSRETIPCGSGTYEQQSRIDMISVVPSGEFDHFPVGFMDEWNKQLLELI